MGELVDKAKPDELSKYTAFIIESVNRVFTSPTEAVFEKSGSSKSAQKTVKGLGDFVERLAKVITKQ